MKQLIFDKRKENFELPEVNLTVVEGRLIPGETSKTYFILIPQDKKDEEYCRLEAEGLQIPCKICETIVENFWKIIIGKTKQDHYKVCEKCYNQSYKVLT